MLEVSNLDCVRGERRLFHDVSFLLRSGECLLITGENGSGKTSLLRMLVGLTPPFAGTISWNTRLIKRLSVIDIESQSILETVVTGNGAHGVVASDDGNFVFITNTADNTVSAIDTKNQSVVATYSVGPNPNGITYRSAP